MGDLIKRLGIGGALGALVGIGLVIWIEPSGGIGLVFWVGVLVTVVVVEVGRWGLAWRGSRRSALREEKEGEEEDGTGVNSGNMERLQTDDTGGVPEKEGGE